MKYKCEIVIGAISFFIGVSFVLLKMYWNSISAEMVYYIISMVLLEFVNNRVLGKKIQGIAFRKISLVLWYVGFFIGYGIDYLYM